MTRAIPPPRTPLGIRAIVSRNIELACDNSDMVWMTLLVCGHRLNEMESALSCPKLKFLAAELVQQGFIFKEAA